jgi:site-specific DNA recombinase
MRVAVHVRVSTSLPVKLQTIEQQLEMVRRQVKEKGWELSKENVFCDGYSGVTLKRPALDALRDKVRLRKLDVAVALSPDRLARDYVHQMVLIEELENQGLQARIRRETDEPRSQRPASSADPGSSGRIRGDASHRAYEARQVGETEG